MNIPKLPDLARAFDAELRLALEPHEYAEAIRRNAEEPEVASCASHDFCDANMVMLAAFSSVTGMTESAIVRLTCGDGEDAESDGVWVSLWNDAWEMWRTMPKEGIELPEGASMTTAGEFREDIRLRVWGGEYSTDDAESDASWHGIRADHPDDFPYIVWEDGGLTPWYGKGVSK